MATKTRASVEHTRSTMKARAAAEARANRLVAVHWRVVDGPEGPGGYDVMLEDPARFSQLGIDPTRFEQRT